MNNKRKFWFTLAEGATHVDTFNNKRKFGFTLAEVLITLGIIGVVAAMTIPTLIANYQTKSWNTAAQVFEAKFTEALKTMNVQGRLGRYGKYNDTEGFVAELQKHFKTTKVCDNNSIMQCFEKNITMNDEEIDLSSIKTASDFGQTEWGTNVMGIQFANGVTGLIAYNPKCKSDPHDNRISGGDCYALVYDTSGFSDPNEIGKDARKNGNVLKLGNSGCAAEVGGICFGTAFLPTPMSKAECEAEKDALGLAACEVDNDYFAGAVKQCGGVNKVANANDLYALSNYIYEEDTDDAFGDPGKPRGENADLTKLAQLGINTPAKIWIMDNGPSAYASILFYYDYDMEIDIVWGRETPDILAICTGN